MHMVGLFVLAAAASCSTLVPAQAASESAVSSGVSADGIIAGPKVCLPERTGDDLITARGPCGSCCTSQCHECSVPD